MLPQLESKEDVRKVAAPLLPESGAVSRIVSGLWEQAGMVVVLLLVFIGCSIFVPNFATRANMLNLALAVSTIGIISCTMLFCLASGDFDLSVGSVVACAGVLAAVVINKTSGSLGAYSVIVGVLAGVTLGGLVGLFNGFVVARLGINALITTLATMQIARGMAYIISGGKAVGVSQEKFFLLGSSAFLGVTTPVWVAAMCFLFFGFLLRSTTFGRNTLAIGGNAEAARLSGIPVSRIKIIIFTAQGVVAAFAGVILASRFTSGQPMTSQGLELEVISACVLGGVSLTGGVGSMVFVVSGVLIMGMVQNAMNLANVDSLYQYVVRGTILLCAVIFDKFKHSWR